MRLKKAEKEALASLLEAGAETPEALVEDFVKLLDQLRGERSHHYACAIVAGIPMTIGPYSTRGQADKAIRKLGGDCVTTLSDDGTEVVRKKIWIVPGWTEEGWLAHLAEVDKEPVPAKQGEMKNGTFWGRVSQIKDNELTAIVGHNKQDIEIKAFPLSKGAW